MPHGQKETIQITPLNLEEILEYAGNEPVATYDVLDAVVPGSARWYLDSSSVPAPDRLNAEEEVDIAMRIEAGVYAFHVLQKTQDKPEALASRQYTADELIGIVQDGQSAFMRMLESNQGLVRKYAKLYKKTEVTEHDLIQEGNIALVGAIRAFDYKQGNKFSTFATWTIRGTIRRASLIEQGTVTVSARMGDTLAELHLAEEHLREELGREPTRAELAHLLEIKESQVAEYQSPVFSQVSSDKKIGSQDDIVKTIGDDITANNIPVPGEDILNDAREQMFQEVLSSLMSTLSDDQKRVYTMYHGIGTERLTMPQIAAQEGLTKQGIAQRLKKADMLVSQQAKRLHGIDMGFLFAE